VNRRIESTSQFGRGKMDISYARSHMSVRLNNIFVTDLGRNDTEGKQIYIDDTQVRATFFSGTQVGTIFFNCIHPPSQNICTY
jgi:hypothetical protein